MGGNNDAVISAQADQVTLLRQQVTVRMLLMFIPYITFFMICLDLQIRSSFANMDPFGTGQTLPPLQLPQTASANSTITPLKKPPKWIRRPVGASFAVSFIPVHHRAENCMCLLVVIWYLPIILSIYLKL